MHQDGDDAVEDPGALPDADLRRRVYAQGADESDERWIRAAAELDRRERARSGEDDGVPPFAGPHGGPGTDPSDGDADGDADADATRPRSRVPRVALAAAAGALAVGLIAGVAVGTGLGTAAPDDGAGAAADRSDSAADDLPRTGGSGAASTGTTGTSPNASASPALLGPESLSDTRSRPIGAILESEQTDGDLPPRQVRADVDPASVRGVQTSVGLYAARTVTGDLCLLVFPDGGSAVLTCGTPDQVSDTGLRIAWTTVFPSRNRDGSVGTITGDVTASWSTDGLITLTTPGRLLAY